MPLVPGNTAFGSLNQFKGSIDNINLEDYLVMQYDSPRVCIFPPELSHRLITYLLSELSFFVSTIFIAVYLVILFSQLLLYFSYMCLFI